MSQLSLSRRIERLFDVVLPPGSEARKVHDLPPHLRDLYERHRANCDRTAARIEQEHGPGALYAQMIEGEGDPLPQMPRALRDALVLVDPPAITEADTVFDAADAWQQFALGDER